MSSASSGPRARLTGADAIRNRWDAADSEYSFPRRFAAFAPAAWARYHSSSGDVEQWAREESRRFYHEMDRRVPFLRTFYALLRFAETQEGLEEQRAAVREEAIRTLKEAETAQRDTERAAEVFDKMVERLLHTWNYEDMKDTRSILNQYCWREHARWWDAFQAEEDGENGWINQTAKILSRSVGYRQDFSKAAVCVWLEKSRAQFPDRF